MSESKSNSKVVNSAKNMISVMRVKQQTDISPRAREKGAAKIWTTPPNEKFGFVFKAKADFWDALALRYHRSIRPPVLVVNHTAWIIHKSAKLAGSFT